jgi:type II secretory pathway pseudopilin PulG
MIFYHSQPRPKGFTNVELLVVIGVIVLLASITVLGLRTVLGGVQEKQTRAAMQSLDTLLSQAIGEGKDAEEKLYQYVLPRIYTPVATVSPYVPPQPAPPAGIATMPMVMPRMSVDRGGLSTNEYLFDSEIGASDVNGGAYGPAVLTAHVIKSITSSPTAKSTFETIAPDLRRVLKSNTEEIDQIDRRPQRDPRIENATGRRDGMVLVNDGWGNPILFVHDNLRRPSSSGTTSELLANTGGLTGIYTAESLFWSPTATAPNNMPDSPPAPARVKVADALYSPDRRPFWMSAGPDGDYQTHDDNIYSFEN